MWYHRNRDKNPVYPLSSYSLEAHQVLHIDQVL